MRSVLMRHALPDQPQHVLDSLLVSVVVPEESTNLITNPSFENGTTGWTNNGAVSMARTTAVAFVGGASLAISTNTADTGARVTVTNDTSNNTLYTFSVWARGSGRVYLYAAGDVTTVISAVRLTPIWQRYTLAFRYTTDTVRYVGVHQNGSGVATFNLDGAQLELKPYPTTYIDGDQDDCIWLGAPHASQSYRSAQTRKGGRVVKLRDFGFQIAAAIGLGAVPLATVATPYALIGGAYYQRSIPQPRSFSLVGGFDLRGDTLLKRARADLWRALNPNLTGQPQPARLIFEPAACGEACGEGMVVDAVYTSGLEGNQTNDVGIERAALNFQVFLPFAAIGSRPSDSNASLDVGTNLSTGGFMSQNQSDGSWTPTASGANSHVYASAVAPDGSVYIGGNFTAINGSARNYIAKYDPVSQTTTAMGSGMNGAVYAIAVGADGNVYVGGAFTTAGGSAIPYLAKWNGSTWSAVGTGANNVVYALKWFGNKLYVGGLLTSLNGTAVHKICVWDGSAATDLASAITGDVGAIEVAQDGTLYVAGNGVVSSTVITSIGGVTVRGIARRNPSTGVWDAMGGGIDGGGINVYALALAPDGRLYAGGEWNTISSVVAPSFAVWNGAGWAALSSSSNGLIYALLPLADNQILVGGQFSSQGGVTVEGLALWSGSEFLRYDFEPGGTNRVYTLARNQFALVVGGRFISENVGQATTVTVNQATGSVSPKFVFTATISTKPVLIRNWTTGKTIYFSPFMTVNDGEVFTLTTGPTPRLTSNLRGDVSQFIAAGSRQTDFQLVSGTNKISLQQYFGSASLQWRESIESLDQIY